MGTHEGQDGRRDSNVPSSTAASGASRKAGRAPLEPDIDPWTGTTEQRGQERDDPFDTPPDTAFGRAPETLGIPNLARGVPRTRPSHTSRGRLARAALLVLLLAPIIIRAAAWGYNTLLTWLS